MPDRLRLSPAQLETIIGHALAGSPEEACGILAGDGDGTVRRVFTMENAEHSRTFYMMDSREQFQVFDKIEREGLMLLAIFHSHPHSPAFPSSHDRELAFYPDSLYLIISLMEDEPDYHAFRIVDELVEEVPVLIEDHINL
jgi:proteasome lid subunit RPN8/RPN11